MDHRPAEAVNRPDSAALWNPPAPVNEICGKYAAFATPMSAFAAMSCCSAKATSGRRSRRPDGRSTGTSGACG